MEHNKLIQFEKILNQVMPKSFTWWKKIEIQTIKFASRIERTYILGMLVVDQDWIEKQYYEYYNKPYFNDNFDKVYNPEDTEELLQFGDIVGSSDTQLTKKLREVMTHIGEAVFSDMENYEYTINLCGVKGDL